MCYPLDELKKKKKTLSNRFKLSLLLSFTVKLMLTKLSTLPQNDYKKQSELREAPLNLMCSHLNISAT